VNVRYFRYVGRAMPLNLYRRHRQDCEAGYPEESRSGEFDERKKGWKRSGVLAALPAIARQNRSIAVSC
jgi:hypothetical protein